MDKEQKYCILLDKNNKFRKGQKIQLGLNVSDTGFLLYPYISPKTPKPHEVNIAKVTIVSKSPTYITNGSVFCMSINVEEFLSIEEYLNTLNLAQLRNLVRLYNAWLTYIDCDNDFKLWCARYFPGSIRYMKYLNDDIIMAALEKDGLCLAHIRLETLKSDRAEYYCLTAVRENGYAIKYIKNQTHEMKLAAIKQNPNSIKYINDLDDSLIKVAIHIDAKVIQFVPKQLLTLEICRIALTYNSTLISFVPDKMLGDVWDVDQKY